MTDNEFEEYTKMSSAERSIFDNCIREGRTPEQAKKTVNQVCKLAAAAMKVNPGITLDGLATATTYAVPNKCIEEDPLKKIIELLDKNKPKPVMYMAMPKYIPPIHRGV